MCLCCSNNFIVSVVIQYFLVILSSLAFSFAAAVCVASVGND